MIIGSTIGTKIPGHKHNTQAHGVKVLPEPTLIYVPTTMYFGQESKVLVKRGSKVKKGQLIAELAKPFYMPTFATVSGKVTDFVEIQDTNGNVQKHIVIENNFKDETTKEFKQGSLASTPEEIIAITKAAGVHGLGGAGFPTYVKLGSKGIHTLLINAVECEPYLTSDKFVALSDNNAIDLFIGALLERKALGAEKIVIALKRTNKAVYQALQTALANWDHADKECITIRKVKNKYPMGWERTLIRHLFKKEYDMLPSELGIVVNNLTTVIALKKAVIDGEVLTKRFVTVAGDAIANQRTVLSTVYSPASHLIKELGGYLFHDVTLTAGGPMMGGNPTSDEFACTSTVGGLLVQEAAEYIETPCLRCGKCVDSCPAGLHPVQIKDALRMNNFDALIELEAEKCISCGLCSFICPSRIELTSKIKIAAKIVKNKKAQAKK